MDLNFNWEFNVLNIENFNIETKLSMYFNFIKENDLIANGDIIECGVFNGRSIIATAMLLKKIGSEKKVYGYDSFGGFPPVYHAKDELSYFEKLIDDKAITKKHFDAVKRNIELRSLSIDDLNVKNISSSGDFSNCSLDFLQRKLDFLELDNVVLVKGDFKDTMKKDKGPKKIFAALIDCDLYSSYHNSFEFIWPRLNKGGLCFLDEYYSLKFPGARAATNEFLSDKSFRLVMQNPPEEDEFERWAVIKK